MRKLKLLMAACALMAGSVNANAYTTSELTSAGWTKVTSLTDVDNYYYVLVDAASSDYVMGRMSYGTDRPVYMSLANPMGFAGVVWSLGADGDNYTIKNLGDNKFFISGTAGWNDSMNDNQNDDEGRFTFTLNNGKYDIKSVKTSSYVGPWNNDNKVSLSDGYENIAANKGVDQAPGFYLYAMSRTDYNSKRITASWLTNHGWSEVTDNAQLGNTSNYYLFVESVTSGYALARTSNGRPASKSLFNPFATPSLLWQTEASGSGYKLQSAFDLTYFTSAAGDWNTSMSNTPNADIIATLADGVYTLSAGGTLNIGHWRDGAFPYESESVAANKNEVNRNSYHIYTISKTDYATQKAALISTAAAAATEAAPANLSEYIVNNSDFGVFAKMGWTVSGSWGNQQTYNGAFESWNSNGVSVTQDLADMPGGLYKLTVQMVSGDAGRVPYLYANGDEEYTANVSQQATNNSYDGMKGEIAADANYGLLTVNPHLTGDGSLTVGMKAPSGWVVFDNYKLYYLGKTIKSEAVALPVGGDMEAGKWYYFDITAAADNYSATATTLDDIVYTTDGMTLIENQSSISASFVEKDNSLVAARYYVKSSTDNKLEVDVASYSYSLGTPTFNISNDTYISNAFAGFTVAYNDAQTNDPDASLQILDVSKMAVLRKGSSEIESVALTGTFEAPFTTATLDLNSTYTITIPAGAIGYNAENANDEINITFHTGVIANGVYYFKKNDADTYITRGGWYGTEAVADNFGLSFETTIQTDGKYYLKNVDHSLSANTNKYLNGEGSTYTDSGTAFGWTIEATEGGYYLRPSDTQYMAATAQGEYPYSYMSKTTDAATAYVWNILTKAEYATAVSAAKNAQASAIATAAGKSAATVAELEGLLASDFGSTDMTTNIQGAALKTADDMAKWTQVKYNGETYKNADANGVCAEIWNSTGGVSQQISSLPAGIYKVTVHATWRPGNQSAGKRVGSEANTTAWMYANTASETNSTQLVRWYDVDPEVSSRQSFVDAGDKFLNTTYVYVGEGETLTIGLAAPSFCQEPWFPFYGWTLTRYEAKPTDAEKEALADAITAAEAKTLGFETGEYAPYNNVDALEKLAAAKAIDTNTASGATVVAATTALTDATWTANTTEENAFYGGDFTQYETVGGQDLPYGWNLYNTGNNSRIMGGTEGSSNAGLAAVSSGKALLMKFNATYGESTGYTMPLKAGKIYKISFKYGGWNNAPATIVSLTDPSDAAITLAPNFRPATQDAHSDATHWYDYTGYFVATTDGDYKIHFNKVESNQQQIVIADIDLRSASVIEFADGAVPTYAPGTYPAVKISRTLTAGRWATAVYPFAVSGVDKIAVLDSYDAENSALGFKSATASTANEPFLMRSTAGVTEISLSNVEVAAASVSNVVKDEAKLIGTYASEDINSSETVKNYVLSSNVIYPVSTDDSKKATIAPYRAYFEITQPTSSEARALSFFIDGEEVTSIEGITVQKAVSDKLYNLNGQRVNKAQKGLFIKNGKKYVK